MPLESPSSMNLNVSPSMDGGGEVQKEVWGEEGWEEGRRKAL